MPETKHGSFAIRANWRLIVRTPSDAFEQRAARLYKFLARFLSVNLLDKITMALYEIGIFFLQFFHLFFQQAELRVHEREVLLNHGNTLDISQGCDQAAKGQK